MRREDWFLFAAARQTLEPRHIQRMAALAQSKGFQWERVFITAEHHRIAPLIYHHVNSQPVLVDQIPAEILKHAQFNAIQNAFNKKERAGLLCAALRYFHDRGIPVLVIKGAAQELLVYDEPWYTSADDIDLILGIHKSALTDRQLRDTMDHFHRKHVEYDYYEHHDMNMNGVLPVDFESVWQNARPIDCRGEPGLVLSPEDHLLAICINSCRKRFFRLKSLFDIHETILKCGEIDWERFARRAARFDCTNIVYTALLVASRTLETPVPWDRLAKLKVSPLRSALIHTGVGLLMRLLSLSDKYIRPRRYNRLVDPNLLLAYLSYRPDQILHKFRQIREAHR